MREFEILGILKTQEFDIREYQNFKNFENYKTCQEIPAKKNTQVLIVTCTILINRITILK